MVFVSIHNVEKLEINKDWLDSNTYVLRMKFISTKNERTEITVFSKASEPFTAINQNIKIEN